MIVEKVCDVKVALGRQDENMFEFVVDNEVVLKLLDPIHADQLFKLTNSYRPYLRNGFPGLMDRRMLRTPKLLSK